MEQTVIYVAGAILASCITLAIAFITKIDSKFNECIKQRKNSLDNHFITEINKTDNKPTSIDHFLSFFEEHNNIKDWKDKRNSITDLIIYSSAFTLLGLLLGLLNMNVTLSIPTENIFIASGGFFLLLLIYRILNLNRQMQDWQQEVEKKTP